MPRIKVTIASRTDETAIHMTQRPDPVSFELSIGLVTVMTRPFIRFLQR